MEKIRISEVMEMASKATPRQFMVNFELLYGLINEQQQAGGGSMTQNENANI